MPHKRLSLLLFASLVFGIAFLAGRPMIGEAVAQALTGGGSAPATGANVRQTRHNLSPTGGGSPPPSRQTTSGNTLTTEAIVTAAAGQTTEICVYCHTPHAANSEPGTPLWNRTLSTATYTPYSSSSLQATDLDMAAAALAAPSKLCLSCHDGTLALGAISNAPGFGTGSAVLLQNTDAGATGSATGRMPYGRGLTNEFHGFTRRLGTDFRNDHPISFTYDSTLATADGELRNPSGSSAPTHIANRSSGVKPDFPLTGGKMQCSSCHDPHKPTQKFLNKNRMARVAPENAQTSYANWTFSDANDQICVACHTRLGKAWAVSAHAHSGVAGETYIAAAAAVRDFPTTPSATTVWQAGCLNCHDTHTVAGSRRLLREGVGGGTSAVSQGYSATIFSGINSADDYNTTSALENTCYQCHGNSPVITPTALSASDGVPNIQAEFARAIRMPIVNSAQGGGGNTLEVHDITDADLSETQTQLGFFSPENRHVECTDCHNPHRVVKADTFLGGNLVGGDTSRRTHVPARGTTGNEGNIASGALRGIWGIEPSYTATGQSTVLTNTDWMSSSELPGYTVKKGDPGSASTLPSGTSGTNSVTYLTREYQLCFKCHSNYANGPTALDFPSLGHTGGTTSGTNGVTRYTNVAQEFAVRATDPPSTGLDQGEFGECGGTCAEDGTALQPTGSLPADTGEGGVMIAFAGGGTQNHRSWHPVVFPTGRTADERRISSATGNFRVPFRANLGTQTMHCSDCHGHDAGTTWTANSGPNLGAVQGPHGSSNPFLLKGTWVNGGGARCGGTDTCIGGGGVPGLCGTCHNPTVSGTQGVGDNLGGNQPSGFNAANQEGQGGHGNAHADQQCMECHVAVPHGWKNKALLVNLNCVGPEGGLSGTCNSVGNGPYNNAPYYRNARLRVRIWVPSGNWQESSCGFATGGAGGQSGKVWMKDNSACPD